MRLVRSSDDGFFVGFDGRFIVVGYVHCWQCLVALVVLVRINVALCCVGGVEDRRVFIQRIREEEAANDTNLGILLLVHSMKEVKQEDVSKLFQTVSQRLRPPSMAQYLPVVHHASLDWSSARPVAGTPVAIKSGIATNPIDNQSRQLSPSSSIRCILSECLFDCVHILLLALIFMIP